MLKHSLLHTACIVWSAKQAGSLRQSPGRRLSQPELFQPKDSDGIASYSCLCSCMSVWSSFFNNGLSWESAIAANLYFVACAQLCVADFNACSTAFTFSEFGTVTDAGGLGLKPFQKLLRAQTAWPMPRHAECLWSGVL